MSIMNLLGPASSLVSFNLSEASKKISQLLSGATASLSTLGNDFVGLDVQNFSIIKEEIDAFIDRCNAIKSNIKVDDLGMLALKGQSGFAAIQYVNSLTALIDAYLSFFKSFSALSEDALQEHQEGEIRNKNAIYEEVDTLNNPGLDILENSVVPGVSTAASMVTNAANENIIKESDAIAAELNEFESNNKPTVENLSSVTVSETPSNKTASPGTVEPYQATAYNFNPQEYREFCATVYAEAAEGNEYTPSDTMGVASVMLNRFESGGYNSIVDVLSAPNQFGGYGPQNQKFAAAMNDPSVISAEMMQAINETLAGTRNTHGSSFSGNGTHNSFR